MKKDKKQGLTQGNVLISKRTNADLYSAMAEGRTGGRPPGSCRSKLNPHKDEIMKLLGLGVPKTKIAERFGTSKVNIYNYIKSHKLRVNNN